MALGTGATEIRKVFTPEQTPVTIDAYVAGLKNVFIISTAAFGAATIVGFLGDWSRLDAEKIKKATSGAA